MKKTMCATLFVASLLSCRLDARLFGNVNQLEEAKRRVPAHIVGPQRWFMISRMVDGWIDGTRAFQGYALHGRCERLQLERLLYVLALDLRTEILSDDFYELLPLSCWVRLDLSHCPDLDDATIERVTKAWVEAQRDPANLILPMRMSISGGTVTTASTASAASASASAASTATTQATSNKDQKL